MTSHINTTISIFSADDMAAHFGEFGALLHACVHDGASIGFVLPCTLEDSEAFWRRKIHPRMEAGALMLLAARHQGSIVGTVQLDVDTPPNQPHRAEVRKLLVHPDFRRRGIAQALMRALERLAHQLGRNLLTLDTRTGDTAEPLYLSLGYDTVGVIPGFCRDPFDPARLDSTTIMYKALSPA